MGEKSDQIAHEIEQRRAILKTDLQELERRVETLADWREQFRKRPFTLMGLAFGGGLLLAGMFPGKRSSGKGR